MAKTPDDDYARRNAELNAWAQHLAESDEQVMHDAGARSTFDVGFHPDSAAAEYFDGERDFLFG